MATKKFSRRRRAPRKRSYRRRRGTRTLRGKSKYNVNKDRFVNKLPMSVHQPIPERYVTKMFATTAFTLNYTSGGSNSPINNFLVWGNSLYHPFDTSGCSSIPANMQVNSRATVLTNNTAIASVNPQGWTMLLGNNGLYNYYRVNASSIKIRTMGQSAADSYYVSCVPTTYDSFIVTGAVSSQTGLGKTAGLPWAKTGLIEFNKRHVIKNFMYTRTIAGLTKKQYDSNITYVSQGSQPSTTSGARDAELPWVWLISVSNAFGTVFAGTISMEIDVVYYCEMMYPSGNDSDS